MHKYQPRLHVSVRASDTDVTHRHRTCQLKTFVFAETQFIAVTAYQNHRVWNTSMSLITTMNPPTTWSSLLRVQCVSFVRSRRPNQEFISGEGVFPLSFLPFLCLSILLSLSFAGKRLQVLLEIWGSAVSNACQQMHFRCIPSARNASDGCKCCFVPVEQNMNIEANVFLLCIP